MTLKHYLFYTFFFIRITTIHCQTQRTELAEEFTGEDCNPCAMVNPWINKLVLKNQYPKKKIILLRYQSTPAPSKGSLYSDNPKEVDGRGDYYNVPFAPYMTIDGEMIPQDGNAGGLNQEMIDSKYQVNSPFSIDVSHKINLQGDSIYLNVKIHAFQDYTPSGDLKLRCALTEELIHFNTPPGHNGETDFEFVMRKMIPDYNGLSLSSGGWINGQTKTFNLKAKIPLYIRNKPLMAIVAFIQDDGNKKVLNTAYSEPKPLPFLDISLNSISSGIIGCVTSFSPVIELKNSGTPEINSALIDYSIDNGSINTYKFVGSIPSGSNEKVTLPSVILNAPGKHLISVTVKLPNGQSDPYPNPETDTKKEIIFSFSSPASVLFYESFSSTVFPPNNSWDATDEDRGIGTTWRNCLNPSSFLDSLSVAGSASGGGAAQIMSSMIFDKGLINSMTLPLIHVGSGAILSFYLSSSPSTNVGIPDQKMDVLISKDCGQSWINIYSKIGKDFFTHEASDNLKPVKPADWRKETINLSPYVKPDDKVIIRFEATSGHGINSASEGGGTDAIFIDDIMVTGTTTDISENASVENLSIYPNPAENYISLTSSFFKQKKAEARIIDSSGRTIYTSELYLLKNDGPLLIDISFLSSGIYNLILNTDNHMEFKRFCVLH